MAIFSKNKLNSNKREKDQTKTQEDQTNTSYTQALNASPNPPQATAPIEEQAKEKLTTTGFFKAIYAKDSMLSKKFDNLELENLKYIFDNKTAEEYTRMFGNELKKSPDFKKLKTIKDSLPETLIGGGEGDLIPIHGIDFNKTSNAEAKALAVAYYSNEKNLRDAKKFLYSIAATYAFGNAIDTDALKKETDKINFSKMNPDEIKMEFQKIFSKVTQNNQGKMKFIASMVDRLDKIEKETKTYTENKMNDISNKYAKIFEERTKELFGINDEKGDVYVNELTEQLEVLKNHLKPNETLNNLSIENANEEVMKLKSNILRLVNKGMLNENILKSTKEDLDKKLKEFNNIEKIAKKSNIASKASAEIGVMLHRRLGGQYTNYKILKALNPNLGKDEDPAEMKELKGKIEKAFLGIADVLKNKYPELNISKDTLFNDFKKTLEQNAETIKNNLFIPDNAQYDPFFDTPVLTTETEKKAGSLLNNSLYLAMFKKEEKGNNINNSFVNSINSKDFLQNALKVDLARDINIDEISSFNNIMKILSNISEQKINSGEIDSVINTGLFENNTILNTEKKRHHFKSFIDDFSRKNEKLLSNKIFKKKTDEEITSYVSDKHYKDIDKKLNSKTLRLSLKAMGGFQTLKDYDGCMQKANIVDTKMSTPQANAKQCIDNFIKELEQKEKESERGIFEQQRIYNPLVGFMIIGNMIQNINIYAIKENIIDNAIESAEKLKDIQGALTAQERFAKFVLYKTDDLGVSQEIVDPEYKQLYENTLLETYTKDNLSKKDIDKMFELNFDDYRLDDKTMQKLMNLKETIISSRQDSKIIKDILNQKNELLDNEIELKEKLEKSIGNYVEKYSLKDISKLKSLRNRIDENTLKELDNFVKNQDEIQKNEENLYKKYGIKNLNELLSNLEEKVNKADKDLLSMKNDVVLFEKNPALAKEDKKFFKKYFEDAFKGSDIAKDKEELEKLKKDVEKIKIFANLRKSSLEDEMSIKKDLEKIGLKSQFRDIINNPEKLENNPELLEKINKFKADRAEYAKLKKEIKNKYGDYVDTSMILENISKEMNKIENKINNSGLDFEAGKYSKENLVKMIKFYENALNGELETKFNKIKNGDKFSIGGNNKKIKELKEKLAFLKTAYFYEDVSLAEKLANKVGIPEKYKQEFLIDARNTSFKEALSNLKERLKENHKVVYNKLLNYTNIQGLKDLQRTNKLDNINRKEKKEFLYSQINDTFDDIVALYDENDKELLKTNSFFTKFNDNIMTTASDERAIFFKELEKATENNDLLGINKLLSMKEKFGIYDLNENYIKETLMLNENPQKDINKEQINKYSKRKM